MRFGLFMVFPSFVVKKLESIFIFVTMNLVFFSSVTRSCGEDILSILVRNNKKCLSKLLFISLLIFRRLRSLPVARGVPRRNSALVGEERRGTAVFAGSIYQPLFGKCTRASLPCRLLIRQIQKSPNNERFENWPQ